MRPICEWKSPKPRVVLTDIDDTLTLDGKLRAESYAALWKLSQAGFRIVPVTGRPAGFCEMIARFWPVQGVIGENGAFYFSYDEEQKKMKRHFVYGEAERKNFQERLIKIRDEVLNEVPEAAVASDQFARLFDLAIDFCEDVPALSKEQVAKITEVFSRNGATYKISSIHVNGWFGEHDKLTTCKLFLEREFAMKESLQDSAIFVGDSPNDEPMFSFFENSVGVANVKNFELKTPPKWVCQNEGGLGFTELSEHLLRESSS